jgi:hypothetical protein
MYIFKGRTPRKRGGLKLKVPEDVPPVWVNVSMFTVLEYYKMYLFILENSMASMAEQN